ncbi:MAG: porin family protein [Acidobacteriota bacterium]
MFKKQLKMAVLLAGVMVPVFGQEEFKQDATVQITGNFTKQTDDSGTKLDQTKSAGVLASYRYFFHKNHGVELNYGYTRNSLRAQLGGVTASQQANSHELTAAYVLRFPMRRVTPFALAGAGALLFDPTLGASSVSAQPAFVYGAGADLHVTNKFFVRAQYRGQIHRTSALGPAIVTADDRWLHNAQPTIGFGFRF